MTSKWIIIVAGWDKAVVRSLYVAMCTRENGLYIVIELMIVECVWKNI